MPQAYPTRYQSLGTLDANETIPSSGAFLARDYMAKDSAVLSIIGDVQASGAGTVTVNYYVDSAAALGGASGDTMDASSGYILHKAVSPDIYFTLTMTGRDTDDIDFYAA